MAQLVAERLHIGYENRTIVENLNLAIPIGKMTALIGANGSGKSTILKTMARIMAPQSGHVLLDGKSIHRLPTRDVAKRLAVLPQMPVAPDGLTVAELVSYGRFPHRRGLASLTREDREAIDWALRVTGMTAFAHRPVDSLSGGQRQKAWIAMALAQQTPILFLDEPTTYLDVACQLEVLQLLRKLNEKENRTVVMVVHDLNHAARFAHHLVAIRAGKVVREGTPEEVMTPEVLKEVFGIEAVILRDPQTGAPVCLPCGLA